MKIVHALQKLEPSIFLAGPTPRDYRTKTWRKEAIGILQNYGYAGTIFVPESENWNAHDNYDSQVHWEWIALNQSTRIVFWIPRELEHMPAFTTNVEFGMSVHSHRCLLGYPADAPKMRYLHSLADKFHIPVYHDLRQLLEEAAFEAEQEIEQCCNGEV